MNLAHFDPTSAGPDVDCTLPDDPRLEAARCADQRLEAMVSEIQDIRTFLANHGIDDADYDLVSVLDPISDARGCLPEFE